MKWKCRDLQQKTRFMTLEGVTPWLLFLILEMVLRTCNPRGRAAFPPTAARFFMRRSRRRMTFGLSFGGALWKAAAWELRPFTLLLLGYVVFVTEGW
jgi:hypothetical protein